jgi:subtilase family serine protease
VNDVNTFSAHYGLPLLNSSNFQQIVSPGTSNFPENRFDPQGWFGEETLDVEWVHAMAPGAKIVFAGGLNSQVPLDHALIDMIDNHRADVISNSWGIYGEANAPGQMRADEQAFEQAAAEGITVLFSSGDNGDVASITGLAQGSWPATSPYVTAVGGTSLALHDPSGSKDEWGWGTYISTLSGSTMSSGGASVTGTGWTPWPPPFVYGSGGGISVHFAQPSYQAGVVPTSLASTTTTASGATVTFASPHRVVPDISLDADPNTGVLVGETYQVSGDTLIDQGCTPLGGGYEYCERRLGGTSLASPLMAGIVALVDQAREAAGNGPIGFLNPAIYSLGYGSGAIRDVLAPASPTAVLRNTGSTGQTTTARTINSVPQGTTGPVTEGADSSLRTTANWDDVTGLGTPWAPNFVSALVNWQP